MRTIESVGAVAFKVISDDSEFIYCEVLDISNPHIVPRVMLIYCAAPGHVYCTVKYEGKWRYIEDMQSRTPEFFSGETIKLGGLIPDAMNFLDKAMEELNEKNSVS